jgi:hypothetical protein
MEKNKSRTPDELDRLARSFVSSQQMVEWYREELIREVRKFGMRPARANKTKVLEGNKFEVRVTESQEVVVDQEAARALRIELDGFIGGPGLFFNVFEALVRPVEYFVQPGAYAVLAGALPKSAPRNLRRRFAAIVKMRATGPRLEVRKILHIGAHPRVRPRLEGKKK